MLNAFFETGDEHKTDEQRNEFATHMLNDLRFLYAHTQGDDKAVRRACFTTNTLLITLQGWRGIFRSELVLKAFTTHLIAIQGGRYIRELGTPNEMCPRAALALSVTAVSAE